MSRLAVLTTLLLAAAAHAELPVGEQLLHTKDGRELRGVVVSETQQGYLFKMGEKTELVPFANIQDIVPAGDAPPPVVAPPPPPPPVEPQRAGEELPPPPPVPPPSPGTPPPPAPEPEEQREPEPPANDWRSERKGFHWSLGAGGMIDPGLTGSGASATFNVAGFVGAVPSLRWGFGWLDLSAEVMPLGYFRGAVKALFMGLNPQLRINFARFYALGVGLYGAVVFSPNVDFCVGPSFSPAIFRFGSMGEHEVRFWVASPLLATSTNLSSGVVLMLLSYSYVF